MRACFTLNRIAFFVFSGLPLWHWIAIGDMMEGQAGSGKWKFREQSCTSYPNAKPSQLSFIPERPRQASVFSVIPPSDSFSWGLPSISELLDVNQREKEKDERKRRGSPGS
ncbi:hypothetical protein CROQUDRAFT_97680 [Cronartium quercuum f. sp. fusiforme G11]|uniref:Uncharacterized protein n=1 Tax=Cronartium quercuum f. sp. fusiforme G11 TaxID=708437 RepID=A0A9P6N9Y1_9BASI|nr:hypothetical protein CROQUDRAFT_97680 [Cronartium quercuum f. sp. fusiforme G11]